MLCSAATVSFFLFFLGHWVWISGSSTANSPSLVRVKKTDVSPFPGARHGVTAWTDEHSRVWIFGYGADKPKAVKSLDDLWVFNPSKKQWVLLDKMGASSNQSWPSPCVDCVSCSHKDIAVIFGGVVTRKQSPNFKTWVLNMSSKSWKVLEQTSPPAREKSAYWCDNKQGALWLYGGVFSSKDLGDMWQFNFQTMNWTEIKLQQNTTTPKARFGSSSWLKHPDQLFLFGGKSVLGFMSDLWMYKPSQGTWEFVKGSQVPMQKGVYGQQGVSGNLSMPGCREEALSWVDSERHLWLFGGHGCDANTSDTSSTGLLSDLWIFNTSSSYWTWVSGPSKKNEKAVYGKKGFSDPQNMPGPREDSITFRQGGDLWIFGGIGQDKDRLEGLLNDMWVYSISVTPSLGPPHHGKGLPGDTLDMPYSHRLMIAFGILTVAMVVSLLVCYRKECNLMYWRYKKKVPRVKYEPLKVKMQVPDV